MTHVRGTSDGPGVPGVVGDAGTSDNDGVQGFSASNNRGGVIGVNTQAGVGVKGVSELQDGVQGFSKNFDHFGVIGDNQAGVGVRGQSTVHDGVQGVTRANGRAGVVGVCDDPVGGNGVLGRSNNASGVVGQSSTGIGVLGVGGQLAGRFEGNVEVTGDIVLLNAGDCAEHFLAADQEANPGSVVVLANDQAMVTPSRQAYDKRVVGVVSGAGDYKPGIILGNRHSGQDRKPIALLGRVFCKVDARYSAIDVGDMLTTSHTVGHAMKAVDATQASGSIIGKALKSLPNGQGLIPVLITLQ
ncbi:hypothetical protein ACH419_32680 [Streptomyces bobili]|uniref:hypothetical protein n=1 Tax=Streptomyces bobili TaxID=67280 RepID=UPI0037913916